MRHFICTLAAALLISACGNQQDRDEDFAKDLLQLHGEAERLFKPDYLHRAFGKRNTRAKATRYPWPFELLSIGHSIASYQNYGGAPYFHHGLDIRGDAGTDVLASAGGEVVNIENYVPGNPAYWEIAILDENGFLWQYHHIDRSSIPAEIWEAYRSKESIPQGTKIGEIFYWSVVTFGERFHHVHLNILAADGNYQNPFAFLEPLADVQHPDVVEVGLLKNGRRWARNEVSGSYSLFATVGDLILHERFTVPPYEIKFAVDDDEAVTVWRFDGLPGEASNERFVENLYVPSLTCGNYSCRKLTFDLGFEKSGSREFTSTSGRHDVKVYIKDFAGNISQQDFSWNVR